jgi:hypothetical protein
MTPALSHSSIRASLQIQQSRSSRRAWPGRRPRPAGRVRQRRRATGLGATTSSNPCGRPAESPAARACVGYCATGCPAGSFAPTWVCEGAA